LISGINGATANQAKKQTKNASQLKWNARICGVRSWNNSIRVALFDMPYPAEDLPPSRGPSVAQNADQRTLMHDALHHLCQRSDPKISHVFQAYAAQCQVASSTSQGLKRFELAPVRCSNEFVSAAIFGAALRSSSRLWWWDLACDHPP
jgi:hypothetical protein